MTDRPTPEPFASEAGAASAHLPVGPAGRAWRLLDRVVVAGFVVALLVPGGLLLAGRRPAAIENRPLLRAPAISLAGIADGSYAAAMDAFLADNMALRPYAVRLRAQAEWVTGGTGNPAVVRGRDGWLFTAGEFDPVCRHTADEVVASLAAVAARADASGQAFRFVGVPDKRSVYPDRVASNPFPAACSATGRAALRTGLAAIGPVAIDGWAALAAARAADPNGRLLYYPLDSHWTPAGAIAEVKPLIESFGPDVWSDADVVIGGTEAARRDLARQMGLRGGGTVARVRVRPVVTVTRTDVAVPVELHNARAVFRTTASGDRPLIPGRTVIVYDSFFGIDVDLVAPFFADVTWVHAGDLAAAPELAGLLGPFDTVILERVERGLYDDDPGAVVGPLIR
jgi:acetyltransferase AlgX (SGNH hydrolase-like protein)